MTITWIGSPNLHKPTSYGVSGSWLQMFSVVLMNVFRVSRVQFQVLNSIIGFNSIYMMYNFIGKEITTNMLFNFKSMFKNVPSVVGKGMIRFLNKNISSLCNGFSTLPSRVFIKFPRNHGRIFSKLFSHTFATSFHIHTRDFLSTINTLRGGFSSTLSNYPTVTRSTISRLRTHLNIKLNSASDAVLQRLTHRHIVA